MKISIQKSIAPAILFLIVGFLAIRAPDVGSFFTLLSYFVALCLGFMGALKLREYGDYEYGGQPDQAHLKIPISVPLSYLSGAAILALLTKFL